MFTDVARLLRPQGVFVCAFSNRLFPTKAIGAGCTPMTSSIVRSSNSISVSLEAGMSLAGNDVPLHRSQATRCSRCGLAERRQDQPTLPTQIGR